MTKRAGKRPYRREHRARLGRLQTQVTRGRILSSARTLFVRDGYHATTIRAIAAEAGVAEPTFYVHFRSKQALVEALMEEVLSRQADLEAAYGRSPAVDMLLAGFAVLRRHYELGADLERVIRDAGRDGQGIDVETGVDDESRRRHARLLINRLTAARMLRKGISKARAADIIVLLSSLEVYENLVSRSGWKPEEYERWLVETAKTLLLETK